MKILNALGNKLLKFKFTFKIKNYLNLGTFLLWVYSGFSVYETSLWGMGLVFFSSPTLGHNFLLIL